MHESSLFTSKSLLLRILLWILSSAGRELDPFMGVARPRARFNLLLMPAGRRKRRWQAAGRDKEFKNLLSFASHKSRVNRWLARRDEEKNEKTGKDQRTTRTSAGLKMRNQLTGDRKREQETNRLSILLCIFLSGSWLQHLLRHLLAGPKVRTRGLSLLSANDPKGEKEAGKTARKYRYGSWVTRKWTSQRLLREYVQRSNFWILGSTGNEWLLAPAYRNFIRSAAGSWAPSKKENETPKIYSQRARAQDCKQLLRR